MKVCQLIPVNHICIGWPTQNIPKKKDKWNLIESSIYFLSEQAGLSRELCDHAIHLVTDREKSMTTAIGHGVAIPHASLNELTEPIGVLVLIPERIEFEAIDHELVYLLMLVLLPGKEYTKHIKTLSSIVELTSHLEVRENISTMNSPIEVWNLISRLENRS